jgi:hypothetical protein
LFYRYSINSIGSSLRFYLSYSIYNTFNFGGI